MGIFNTKEDLRFFQSFLPRKSPQGYLKIFHAFSFALLSDRPFEALIAIAVSRSGF